MWPARYFKNPIPHTTCASSPPFTVFVLKGYHIIENIVFSKMKDETGQKSLVSVSVDCRPPEKKISVTAMIRAIFPAQMVQMLQNDQQLDKRWLCSQHFIYEQFLLPVRINSLGKNSRL